jgi:hypothetical protein
MGKAPDFTNDIIETLSKRAALICSNPNCGQVTSGPHSNPNDFVNIGVAAHIKGARKGSNNRYDETMSDIARGDISNGIWLCQTCSKLIDSDASKFTVDLLYAWRNAHEESTSLKVSGSKWKEITTNKLLRGFELESTTAQQLILDKPKHWTHLLTSEMLKYKLGKIAREYDSLRRGTTYRPTIVLRDTAEVQRWIMGKMDDLIHLVDMMKEAATNDLIKAANDTENPNSADDIKYTTDILGKAAQALFEWDASVKFTNLPNELTHAQEIMEQWGEPLFHALLKIPHSLDQILENPSKSGTHTITITFEPPHNSKEVNKEIQRFLQTHKHN